MRRNASDDRHNSYRGYCCSCRSTGRPALSGRLGACQHHSSGGRCASVCCGTGTTASGNKWTLINALSGAHFGSQHATSNRWANFSAQPPIPARPCMPALVLHCGSGSCHPSHQFYILLPFRRGHTCKCITLSPKRGFHRSFNQVLKIPLTLLLLHLSRKSTTGTNKQMGRWMR